MNDITFSICKKMYLLIIFYSIGFQSIISDIRNERIRTILCICKVWLRDYHQFGPRKGKSCRLSPQLKLCQFFRWVVRPFNRIFWELLCRINLLFASFLLSHFSFQWLHIQFSLILKYLRQIRHIPKYASHNYNYHGYFLNTLLIFDTPNNQEIFNFSFHSGIDEKLSCKCRMSKLITILSVILKNLS
jgi:hypothetical protein